MTWQDLFKTAPLDWLVDFGGPGMHYLVLRDLFELPENDLELHKVKEIAHQIGPISEVLANMQPDGYWAAPGPGYNPKYRSTVWAVILLAQLGACIDQDERIERACSYLLEHSLSTGGQFSMTGAPSGTVDCLQGNLCWSLLELGCKDTRLELAFDWMARTVTGEGLAPNIDRQAPVRYYAGKCGPGFACGANDTLRCAWGAVKVLLALSKLPAELRTPTIQRAICEGRDFLFSIDPATAAYPTGYSDKPSRNWWKFGFPVFYITDLLQLVEAAARLGWGEDPLLTDAITIILEKRDAQGRWALEYSYAGKTWLDFGALKQPNPWVTLRALRTLKSVSVSSR
jgi:hypothetical protein